MKQFRMHRAGGSCPAALPGNDLADAIQGNFDAIAREAMLGNAAGYTLEAVSAEYRPGILGGKGGVELTIRARGVPLATHDDRPKQSRLHTVWIEAAPADCPEPLNIEIRA
jgi:hypothetical protein